MIAAFLTDDLEQLKYQSDSSILLAEELQSQGFKIYQFCTKEVFLSGKIPFAHGRFLRLTKDETQYYTIISKQKLSLLEAKVIFIRHDPPYNLEYLTPVYLLSLIEDRVKILNKPSAIIANPEKLSVFNFSNYIPETLVCPAFEEIESFQRKHKHIIIKPLYGHGGKEVIKVSNANELDLIKAGYLSAQKQLIVVQKFLPSIASQGDRRVLVCDGEIIGAIKRVPSEGGFIANLAAGGAAKVVKLTKREKKICQEVGLFLRNNNIFLAGLDLIDEQLIEINITSPTGLKAVNSLYKTQVEKIVIQKALLG